MEEMSENDPELTKEMYWNVINKLKKKSGRNWKLKRRPRRKPSR